MPVYKMICKQLETLTLNGKKYQNGDLIMDRVVVSEAEAKIMNERDLQISLILIEDPKAETIRPLNQLSKPQLQKEGKEIDLELGDELTRKQMIEAINAKKEELKSL